jgi:hypothetical protein
VGSPYLLHTVCNVLLEHVGFLHSLPPHPKDFNLQALEHVKVKTSPV